jgi:hypothetical protein
MASRFDSIRPKTSTSAKTTSAGSGQVRYVPANASASAAAKQNTLNKGIMAAKAPVTERGIAIPSYATNPKSIAMANAVNSKVMSANTNDGTTYTKPTSTTTPAPVQTTPAPPGPVEITTPEPEPETEATPPPPEWTLEGDPFYQQALADAQAQFNLERIGAQGTKQYQEVGINRSLDERPATAEASRRRLAGNYAARGMGGGNSGALSRAEAESNARETTARTGLREQLSELNRQFVGQYGAEGSDWLGTLRGQSARDTATNFALQNRLAGATTVG